MQVEVTPSLYREKGHSPTKDEEPIERMVCSRDADLESSESLGTVGKDKGVD